jgi:hypothetical protein
MSQDTSDHKRRTPLNGVILVGEQSGYAENPDNWIFKVFRSPTDALFINPRKL